MGIEDNLSPDPADSVGPGSGSYIRESELTMVALVSVIKGGYGGMDIIKEDFVHTRSSPLSFRILVRHVAKDLGTSRKSVIRHGIRHGLALLPARIAKVKEILNLYGVAGNMAMDLGSPAAYRILESGFNFDFIEILSKQYQLPCYPDYRDILSDHSEALGISPSKLAYICIFLSCMTVPLKPGALKTIQRELFHFGDAMGYRFQTLSNIDKYQ